MFRPGRTGDSAGSKVTQQLMGAETSGLKISVPYVGGNEGLGTVHTKRTFECQNGLKNQNYGPPGKKYIVRHWKYQVSENC